MLRGANKNPVAVLNHDIGTPVMTSSAFYEDLLEPVYDGEIGPPIQTRRTQMAQAIDVSDRF